MSDLPVLHLGLQQAENASINVHFNFPQIVLIDVGNLEAVGGFNKDGAAQTLSCGTGTGYWDVTVLSLASSFWFTGSLSRFFLI